MEIDMNVTKEQLCVEFPEEASVVVNFDLIDMEAGKLVGAGGYVQVRREETDFTVTVFDAEGDVVSETHVPFNFKEVDAEQMCTEIEPTLLDIVANSDGTLSVATEVTAEWDGEDWNFRGALIKKHWDMNSTCFSPMELGYSYDKAAQLTPDEAIAALKLWMDESL
jgi:hypothetical protein